MIIAVHLCRAPGPGMIMWPSPTQTGGLVRSILIHSSLKRAILSFNNVKLTNKYSGGGGQPAGGEVQNCMQMRWADGLWDDVSCSGSKEFFVCKK